MYTTARSKSQVWRSLMRSRKLMSRSLGAENAICTVHPVDLLRTAGESFGCCTRNWSAKQELESRKENRIQHAYTQVLYILIAIANEEGVSDDISLPNSCVISSALHTHHPAGNPSGTCRISPSPPRLPHQSRTPSHGRQPSYPRSKSSTPNLHH